MILRLLHHFLLVISLLINCVSSSPYSSVAAVHASVDIAVRAEPYFMDTLLALRTLRISGS